jgi:acyl carrier protein
MKYGNRYAWPGQPAGATFRLSLQACPALLSPARVARTAGPSQTERGRTMSTIAERVKKIVVEHLGVETDKVTESASFIDDLGADSLDTVELVMAFEEEFGCEIPDDAAETILTVGDAVKFLEKNAKS